VYGFRVWVWVIPHPHPKYRVTPEPEPKPNQLGFRPLTRVRVGPTGLGLFVIPIFSFVSFPNSKPAKNSIKERIFTGARDHQKAWQNTDPRIIPQSHNQKSQTLITVKPSKTQEGIFRVIYVSRNLVKLFHWLLLFICA
jgi:hypothetical protein